MKLKTLYVCQECKAERPKWEGRCNDCGAWNSFVEDVVNVGKSEKNGLTLSPGLRQNTHSISKEPTKAFRTPTNIGELDRVLGGGIVEGSMILLAGEPGIGKSTLTLQIVERMAQHKQRLLYITGEESIDQVSERARRLNCSSSKLELLYENSLENILATVDDYKPDFLVIDSIQVMSSQAIAGTAGSLSQVRYVTEAIMHHIKTLGIPTLLIGHVNKEGSIAGPKVLEHLVDTVLLLEGERDQELRLLRTLKNRFGTVSEVGLFEMDEEGLKEMINPGQKVLEGRGKNVLGSCLTLSMEGNRPLLMEIEALVSTTPFGYPKRAATGFDRNRLELLIAVLQKHGGLNLADQDVYIKVVGGLRLSDPAADLAVCLALASSLLKKALPANWVAFGEVGLTGKIAPSFRSKTRTETAERMGLEAVNTKMIQELMKTVNGLG